MSESGFPAVQSFVERALRIGARVLPGSYLVVDGAPMVKHDPATQFVAIKDLR
ncbi:MAG: hypothetical protein IVW51_10195 [Thermaceae bacterium]|nr:hypothetical protein [Thermaceae bacterium]